MRRQRRPAVRLAVLVLAALLLGLAGGFALFMRMAAMHPVDPGRRTDGIAVLTGGGDRVETALRLFADGAAPLLLVSGAHRDATLSDLLRGAELDPAPFATGVTVARAAATTRGNAAEIAAWAAAHDIRSIRVVTAGYHMPRALLELRRALPRHELVPHAVQPARLRDAGAFWRTRTWSLLAGEYLKWLAAGAGLSRFTWVRAEATRER